MEKRYKNFPFPIQEEEKITNTGQNVVVESARPVLITLVCGYFFINLIDIILKIVVLSFRIPGASFSLDQWWYQLIIIGTFIGMLGYWYMRKWGVYLYSLSVIVAFGYALSQMWPMPFSELIYSVLGSAISFFTIIVGFMYLKYMK
tara:strand:+ start:528 stop:965 length:438 start_codon:yes stop_codon:yes gene_type:complete